jgi:type III secretion protein C
MKSLSWLRALVACAWMVFCHAAHAAVPWPDAPYSYYANQAKLETVLADFASGFSLSLAIQPDVAGVVNGRFQTGSPTEFINKLGGMYGFVWYTHAGTLFVSRANDVVTRGVAAPGGNVATMRKALTDLGVLEPRFGWGELGDHGVAMISGPPSYVNLIENTIRNLPARAQQLMVFRLQHASAEDRTVQYRDKEVRIPGLASILRTMVAGGGVAASAPSSAMPGGVGLPMRPAATTTDPGNGTGPNGSAAAGPAVSPPPPSQGPKPMVQSDPRLNAIIIQDMPERMPLYQQLIAQLDVPTVMVEIEAMIIDVSSERASSLGVDWSGNIGKISFGFNADSGATLGISNPAVATGNPFMIQLHTLQSNGDAEIRSKPSVLTSDNIAAILDLSQTFYIRAQGERVATVTPVTAGTTLKVSPHVVQQGASTFVQLKIDIEDGQITSTQVDSLPTVNNSTVSTEATVRNGEALLIAGYSSKQDVKSRKQVPVLGELPIVGAMFANSETTLQKRDRIFLIRPKVIGLAMDATPGVAPKVE